MNVFNYEISVITISVSLLPFGIFGLILGFLKKKRTVNKVSANNGSVAAGRNITAPVTITNTHQKDEPQSSGLTGGVVWNIIFGIASLIGLIGLGVLIAPLLKG